MVSTQVHIDGYLVSEELYNGSRTLVYRAVREIDLKPVVIKLLKNPYPSFSELVQFRNQYTIAKNLNSPSIIQTYSLEPYQNGYALVMEDFGGISLKQTLQAMSLQEFLLLAIALCDTLDILYRERIIHKDIKPANILINPETKQVKLIDFSIASLLPRETQTLVNPNVLEGTLAYISPEQTGRMNRGIDYRTDFYSLGVTFYELLTGKLPFQSNEPIPLVHSHIAKVPPLLGKKKEIPQVVCDIVMKLMAKNAESRYQSALGLKFDLENCLHQLQETGIIKYFEIAQRDVCDRFLIPEKLYGREQEVQTLLSAFGRVANGVSELMLVAGFSGIGKTAVVNEVHKPIVRWNGYFIKGKFDQFNRNIPLNAFVQAFRDMMGQLLSESDAQLKYWKTQILETLGENAQVIIDVIPELEKIVGEQPAVLELSGKAAQNRFNLLFEKFIAVFTTQAHPLVVFIDDLQWADSASLKLLQLLMNDTKYLLLLGAYRDNEVSPAHPLMQTLSDIEKAHALALSAAGIVNTITLAPLDQSSINQLIADTLSCDVKLALPLTELVIAKTKGNPFFTTQFLRTLHEDGLITFNASGNYWECNIAQVRQLALSDDVVEFMALQLLKLPVATQAVLKLAACIGNSFDLTTLAIASEQSELETATNLWKALQEGLILPTSEIYKFYQDSSFVKSHTLREGVRVASRREASTSTLQTRLIASVQGQAETQMTVFYKFLHDRVQQAAYSLIAQEQRPSIHLKIGQLLLNHTSDVEQDNKLFDIVNHLNKGLRLITQPIEQEQIAQLNLLAAKKARSTTAYESAMTYATTGITLLTPDCWQSQYELALMLHELAAENAFLARDFEQMEHWGQTVLQRAKTLLDRVKIYEIKIETYISQHQPLEAIALGKQVLSQFGIQLPEQPTQSDIQQEFQHTANLFAGRPIEELLNLPPMTAPEPLAAMKIAASTTPAVYFTAPSLYPLLMLSQVNASIQHGNAPLSAFFYATYGLLLNSVLEDMEAGDRAGTLALRVMEKLNAKEVESKTRFLLGGYVLHGTNHLRKSLQFLRESYQIGLETGDIEFANHAAYHICQFSYFSSQELLTLDRDIQAYSQMLANLKQIMGFNYCQLFRQVTLNLLGNAKNPRLLVGDVYDEAQVLPQLLATKDQMALHFFYLHKLILGYLFGDTAQSLSDIATRGREYLAAGTGYISLPIFYFYDSLVVLTGDFNADAELSDAASGMPEGHRLQRVAENQAKLQKWASHAPMNHLHKWHLVEAEKYRVLGNKLEASDQYDRAISLAKANEYIQEAALANELAARFYLSWGKERIAGEYMTEAYYSYARWGSPAKLADLEQRYPQLLALILQQTRTALCVNETVFPLGTVTSNSSATSISHSFDLAAILKASQTLSSEIELKKLLSSWLSIVIENAGADKCVLMLLQDDSLGDTKDERLLIKGSMTVGTQPVVLQQRLSIENSQDIPHRLIYKVKHEKRTAVLIDPTTDLTLAKDPYIMRQQPKSILCSPILHQGKLLGVLYLENNLATGAFTSDRVELLNLLCAQAAISLENARLYEQVQQALENARLMQFSINRVSTPVCWVEPDARISYANNAFCRDIGYSQEEMLTKYVYDINPEFSKDSWLNHWQSVKQQGTVTFETSICNREGIRYPVEVTINYIEFQEKEYHLTFVVNISDRKKAELALQQKSLDLQQALQDLQQAQLQIIQSEKMSALGNLVAGVAHEMNNPLGFIAASLKQAKPTFTDIVEHLKLYQESLPDKSEEILDHAEEIDLDYSLSDLPKMIDSMTMACDRLKNISTSLRTFSRADKDYKVPFNIHEGIDSTVLILKHRLKANEQRPPIEVVTNYCNLPTIECFPGQVNQVFMNILANAIDALEESTLGRNFEEIQAQPNRITITTSMENHLVKIAILDNGKGMSEEIKQKIFDHLFTTKAVGKGTGLGLAIARQIVEETHGGAIAVESALNEGTKFIISLPL